jgi:hypothetical protein
MRNFTFTLICFLTLNFGALAQSNFDLGFKAGFKSGYCYSTQSSYTCMPPLAPLPPFPQINESRDKYQDGYNRGFLFGTAQRRADDNYSSNQRSANPNPPKFNPYVTQNPIVNLTPEERSAYYAARARQDQATAEAIGFLLEQIFTSTPEGRARRAAHKTQQYYKQKRKEEEKRQAKIIVYGSESYYKLKKSKKIWLGSALVFGTAGTAAYFQSENYYKQYHNATTDAENLYNKGDLYSKISPIAFGLAGICTLQFILKSSKLSKVENHKTSIYLLPLKNGSAVGFTYRF